MCLVSRITTTKKRLLSTTFTLKNGTINQSFTYEYKQKVNETNEELLVSAILEIRNRFASEAQEIIVPFEIDWQLTNAYFTVPQRGDKKAFRAVGNERKAV